MTGTDTSPEACEQVARSLDGMHDPASLAGKVHKNYAALIRALRAQLTTARTDGRDYGMREAAVIAARSPTANEAERRIYAWINDSAAPEPTP